MPPVAPSHGGAVTVPVSVALEYCGTRITWKRRWPWVALALRVRVGVRERRGERRRFRRPTPGPVATTYS